MIEIRQTNVGSREMVWFGGTVSSAGVCSRSFNITKGLSRSAPALQLPGLWFTDPTKVGGRSSVELHIGVGRRN